MSVLHTFCESVNIETRGPGQWKWKLDRDEHYETAWAATCMIRFIWLGLIKVRYMYFVESGLVRGRPARARHEATAITNEDRQSETRYWAPTKK